MHDIFTDNQKCKRNRGLHQSDTTTEERHSAGNGTVTCRQENRFKVGNPVCKHRGNVGTDYLHIKGGAIVTCSHSRHQSRKRERKVAACGSYTIAGDSTGPASAASINKLQRNKGDDREAGAASMSNVRDKDIRQRIGGGSGKGEHDKQGKTKGGHRSSNGGKKITSDRRGTRSNT